MGLAKITITGTASKEPQVLENGDVVVLFKIENGNGDSYYRVLITKETWGSATSRTKIFNHYIVTGKSKASANAKGIPFITVYCDTLSVLNVPVSEKNSVDENNMMNNFPVGTDEVIDISDIDIPDNLVVPTVAKDKALKYFIKNKCLQNAITVKRETKKLMTGYAEYLVAKELGIEKVPVSYMGTNINIIQEDYKRIYTDWFEGKEVVEINVKDIILTEEEHLNTVGFGFILNLKELNVTKKIEQPIAVRPIGDGKYSVIIGVARYFAAKILDIEKIPAVIEETPRVEFVKNLEKIAKSLEEPEKKKKTKGESKNIKKGPLEIELELITIPEAFAQTRVRAEKIEESIAYYKKHGKFDKPIVTKGDDYLLTDGYKRYVAAKEMGLKTVLITNK